MNAGEIDAFATAFAPLLRDYVASAMSPILRRMADLEARLTATEAKAPTGFRNFVRSHDGKLIASMHDGTLADLGVVDGRPGRDIDPDEAKGWIAEAARDAAKEAAITPDPAAIADVLQERMTGVLRDMVTLEVATLPTPENGKDGAPGEPGPAGQDGKDADNTAITKDVISAVMPEVLARASELVDLLPKAVDGKDGEPGEKGEPGPAGQDGKDVDQDFIVRQIDETVARAVAAITIPTPADGKDGIDGADGKSVELDDVVAALRSQIEPDLIGDVMKHVDQYLADIPEPKNGVDGADGKSVEVDDVVREMSKHVVVEVLADATKRVDEFLAEIPAPKDGIDGKDGRDADPPDLGVVARIVEDTVAKAVDKIPLPKDGIDGKDGAPGRDGVDGKSVDPDQIIDAVVERVVPDLSKRLDDWTASVPMPKDGADGLDGKSVDPEELATEIVQSVVERVVPDLTKRVDDHLAAIPMPKDGEPGKDGADGQSVNPREIIDAVEQDLLPELVKKVDEFLAAVPTPENGKDGASITVDDVAPLIEEAAQKAVEALPKPRDGVDGKDGAGVVDALINHERRLLLTFADGRTKELGVVVGKDADMDALADVIVTEIAKIPRPEAVAPNAKAEFDAVFTAPSDIAAHVARAIQSVSEAPTLPKSTADPAPIHLNITTGEPSQPRQTKKTITTRRDENGNLVADVTETEVPE